MNHDAEMSLPVDRSRVVPVLVGGGNRRNVDRSVPRHLPDADKAVDKPERKTVDCEQILFGHAEPRKEGGNRALVAQQVLRKGAADDRQNEIGHIDDRLHDARHTLASQLRNEQRQNDGSEKADRQIQKRHLYLYN